MRSRRLSLFAAAALVASAGLAAPALASPAAHFRPRLRGFHGSLASPRKGTAPQESTFGAGYEWDSSDSIAEAQGATTSFVVPRIAGCTSTMSGIFPSVSVEAPDTYSAAGVFVGCSGGKAFHYPVLVINGMADELASLHPKHGDTIVVSVAENLSKTKVSVTDKTRTGVSKTLTGPGSNSVGGATGFPFIGDLSEDSTIPDFGTIAFSGSQIDGLPLGSFGSDGLAAFDLYDSTDTTLEASTGNISHGESFKTTFVAP